jgi:hypothetical protein
VAVVFSGHFQASVVVSAQVIFAGCAQKWSRDHFIFVIYKVSIVRIHWLAVAPPWESTRWFFFFLFFVNGGRFDLWSGGCTGGEKKERNKNHKNSHGVSFATFSVAFD